MKKIIIIISMFFVFGISASAQTQCPQGLICISQEAANKAAENARLVPQLEEKIKVQEEVIVETKKSITEVRETAAKNEADLRGALHKTELQLAEKTGQLIKSEANEVRMTAIIDFMLKNGRTKQFGLFNIKIGN